MKTLNRKEAKVFANIKVIADVIGGNKYFCFADLADFDLDNTKEGLVVILGSLVAKGYLFGFNDLEKTYRLMK